MRGACLIITWWLYRPFTAFLPCQQCFRLMNLIFPSKIVWIHFLFRLHSRRLFRVNNMRLGVDTRVHICQIILKWHFIYFDFSALILCVGMYIIIEWLWYFNSRRLFLWWYHEISGISLIIWNQIWIFLVYMLQVFIKLFLTILI